MSSGSIEEKIIQRQLSKEGLQNIVDNTDQVNTISTEQLKRLFTYRGDTPSDTHDTLQCKRCRSVLRDIHQQLTANHMPISSEQKEFLIQFLVDFSKDMESKSMNLNNRNLPCLEDIRSTLMSELERNEFENIPQFSKRLREVVKGMNSNPYQLDHQEDADASSTSASNSIKDLHLLDEFINRWVDAVSELNRLRMENIKKEKEKMLSSRTVSGEKQTNKSISCMKKNPDGDDGEDDDDDDDDNNGDNDEDDDEDGEAGIGKADSFEQDGCPDETDFNKYG